MKAHRYAAIFPLLKGDALQELADDIAAHGLREPVVTYRGEILDGRNRYAACQAAGVPCRFAPAPVDDDEGALRLVMSLNMHRRHLTESQRGMAGAKMLPHMEAAAKARQGARRDLASDTSGPTGPDVASAPRPLRARDEAANLTGASARSVQRAKQVLERAVPEMVEAVEDGTIRLHAATRAAKLTAEQQREVVRRVAGGEARNPHQAMREVEQQDRVSRAKSVDAADAWRVDCTDAARWTAKQEAAACVVMDPPYGLATHRTRQGGHDYADGQDYALSLLRDVVAGICESAEPGAHVYCFTGYTHVESFKRILRERLEVQDNPIVWIKDNHTMCDFQSWYPNRYELILFAKVPGGRRPLAACVPDVLTFARSRETTHSAEKPVPLLRLLIEQSTVPGELVVDPFAGSGSTGVAALASGRRFAGCEIDEENASLARARLAGA